MTWCDPFCSRPIVNNVVGSVEETVRPVSSRVIKSGLALLMDRPTLRDAQYGAKMDKVLNQSSTRSGRGQESESPTPRTVKRFRSDEDREACRYRRRGPLGSQYLSAGRYGEFEPAGTKPGLLTTTLRCSGPLWRRHRTSVIIEQPLRGRRAPRQEVPDVSSGKRVVSATGNKDWIGVQWLNSMADR